MSRELVEKWSGVEGKLSIAGIADESIQENMAILLQNQEVKNIEKELFQESFSTGVAGSGASIGGPDSGSTKGVFAPISMALVRRTFPSLFANKVVGVQAMTTPVGLAYAIRFLYGDGLNEAGWDVVPEYSGFTGSISGTSGTADAGTGVATADAEAWAIGTQYPQLKFRLDRVAVEAKTRKLATSFSLESAMDIKAMHDVDIEKELINIIQYEMVAEQDRELVARIKYAAVQTGTFNGAAYGGEAALTYDVAKADGRWSQEKFSNIVTAITDRAHEIGRKTRRGIGNFVIVSPRVATALQAAGAQFTRNTNAVDANSIFPEVGTINGQLKVYRDTYATTDYALVGYKGPGVSDAGLVYSPYVTGLSNRAIDPTDFSPRIGVMSRYAITDSLLGSGRYYRLINFTNLSGLINGSSATVTYTSAV